MRRFGAFALVVVALVSVGCGSKPPAPAEPESTGLLRTAIAAFKDAKTLKASLKVYETGSTEIGVDTTGNGVVVVGTGDMSVTYVDSSTGDIAMSSTPINGELIAVAGATYQRWTSAKTIDQATWARRNPAEKHPFSTPMRPGYLALVSTQLLDPMVLLDTGLEQVEGKVTRKADTATVKYDWSFSKLEPSGRLATWINQTGTAPGLDVTLTFDKQGRVTDISYEIQANAIYTGKIHYEEYGVPASITAPPGTA